MARTKISEFSATPGNNTDIDGINIAEGCAPSGINDAIRELMSQLKDFQAGTAGDSFNGPVGTTTAAAGAFTTLSASSTVSGTGFSNYLASPPAIGGTAAAAGSFTTLSASSTVTLSGGTANGVLYLNGSKVATSGSALTFDGTTLYNSGNISVGGNSGGNRYVAILNETGTYTGTLMLQAGGGSAAYGGAVVMYGHAHASYPGAVYVGSSAGTSTGIIFGGGGNAGPATSEWMRLTSTGLGIGTSSPGGKLDIYQNSSRYVRAYPSSGLADLEVVTNNNVQPVFAVKGTGTADLIRAYAGATQAFTLDSSGNLGLGVTPSAWSGLPASAGVLQMYGGSLYTPPTGGQDSIGLVSNAHYNGTNWIYKATSNATRYEQYAGIHRWYTAASGTAGNAISFTQAMTLDASGRLLVGPTSDISAGGYFGAGQFKGSYPAIVLNGTEASARQYQIGENAGALTFYDATGGTGGERARIDSSGNLLVGTTAPSGQIGVATNLATQNGIAIKDTGTTYGSSSQFIRFLNSSDAACGSISHDTSTSVAYNTSSDYRLKNITGPVTNSGAYIDSLKPCEGTWKTDGSTFVGLIAHEAQEVSRTNVATGEKDGEEMQGLAYGSSEFIANIIAELQSLRKRVAQLEKGN